MCLRRRSGLTLVELTIALAIALVLLLVIVPAIRNMRTHVSPRIECLNNCKQVSLAILNYCANGSGRFPAQGHFFTESSGSDSETLRLTAGHSWVFDILPYLDQKGIHDRWNPGVSWNSEAADTEYTNRELANLYIPQLACPYDTSAAMESGALSYVVNCGIGDTDWRARLWQRSGTTSLAGHSYLAEPFDWDGDGILPPEDHDDIRITHDFGVFWPRIDTSDSISGDNAELPSHTVGKIYDGSANTIMVSENTNAGTADGGPFRSWADPNLSNCGFLLPVKAAQVGPQLLAATGSVAPAADDRLLSPFVNSSAGNEGRAPFPNSNHLGIVTASFCDGSARTISEDIHPDVYAKLLTPSGTRLRNVATGAFVSEVPLATHEF